MLLPRSRLLHPLLALLLSLPCSLLLVDPLEETLDEEPVLLLLLVLLLLQNFQGRYQGLRGLLIFRKKRFQSRGWIR